MPASLPTAPPPLRDAALDAVARLAAELTGLEAAALWLARDAGVPPRWGAFGAPVQWPQLSALATLAHQGAAGADGLSLAQRPVRQALAAPLRGTGGSGLLMAMGFEAGAMPADAPQRLERLAHALGAVQDVTARKQAQEETSRLAMRLTTTLASISDAFVTLDRQGRFLYVNRASEHLLGLGASALLGQPIHDGVGVRRHRAAHDQLVQRGARVVGTGARQPLQREQHARPWACCATSWRVR